MSAEICLGFHPESKTRCPYPAIFEVAAGCVHEHTITGQVCDKHRQAAISGFMACSWCYSHDSEPHTCAMVSRIRQPVQEARA